MGLLKALTKTANSDNDADARLTTIAFLELTFRQASNNTKNSPIKPSTRNESKTKARNASGNRALISISLDLTP